MKSTQPRFRSVHLNLPTNEKYEQLREETAPTLTHSQFVWAMLSLWSSSSRSDQAETIKTVPRRSTWFNRNAKLGKKTKRGAA